MRYSIEPKDRIYVKGYEFLSFAKNIGKSLSNKYAATSATNVAQKLIDSAKKCKTDAIKTASKRAIQKTAEATGDLIGNKIADKITSVSTELHSKKKSTKDLSNDETEEDMETTSHKKDTYLQKKDSKLLMNYD